LISGVLLHGLYLGGVFWSVKHGLPAGIAALIAGLQPLATGLLVGPLLGERVSGRRWAGIAAGFVGAALVVSPKIGGSDGFPPTALAVCLLAMVSITFGTIWQKRTAQSVDLRTNTVIQYMGAAAVTVPIALLTEQGRLEFVPALWIGLIWAVFGLSIGAIGLLLVLIRRGAVAGVAALLYLVPPASALMAFAIFGETLTPIQIVGMGAAALGVALASRG
jgi:drug/metabolite transporter (DMT)-like permease